MHLIVSPKRRVIAILLVAVVVATATIGVISYGGLFSSPPSTKEGIHIGFSVAPAPLYSKSAAQVPAEVNGHATAQMQFLFAGIDLYTTPAPLAAGGNTRSNGSAPLLQLFTNSTGVAAGVIPAYVMYNARNWTSYYHSQSGTVGNTSFILQLTYSFVYNNTEDMVVPYSSTVSFDPSTINLSSVFDVTQHPDLSARPSSLVQLNPTTSSMVGTASPDRLPGCDPSHEWGTAWVQTNQSTFSDVKIPLAWGNDTYGSQEMTVSLAIGSTSNTLAYQAGNGYDMSGSTSFFIEGSPSSNSGGSIQGTCPMSLYPANSQYGSTSQSGYIWAKGNIVVTGYREKEINLCFGNWYWLNNNESIPQITGLDSTNGVIAMGAVIAGSSDNSLNVYSSPAVIQETHYWNGLVGVHSYTTSAEGSETYGAIYSDLVSTYNNLVGQINGIIGIGLALLGVVSAADAADLGAIPADILAIAGFVSAVVAQLASGMVNATASTSLFVGFYSNSAGVGGGSLTFEMYSMNTQIGFNGNQYTFPIMDALAT